MVYKLKVATRFKKDLKKFQHNKVIQDKLESIITSLLEGRKLPEKNQDHDLVGNYLNHRECHVNPDLLLIYKREDDAISLERLGSHSELF